MTRKRCLTPDEFRQRLFRQGKTLTRWASEHGYTFREASRVLNGQVKGRHGRGHDIAVAMGIKPDDSAAQHFVADSQPTTANASRNPQRTAVA